jgi:glycosyltransferase involved in cell wall biosynthesis
MYNEKKYIAGCLRALLDQTFRDYEIVIVDDHSTDCTREIVRGFHDQRIRSFTNERRLGHVKTMNKSLRLCRGDYVFFTGADCTVEKDWIEQGMNTMEANDCAGVEGTIYYVSRCYQPTFSDHVMRNVSPGSFMTGNMAYSRKVVEDVGGFDEKYTYHSDRNLALKVMRAGGRICFNPNMIVYHPQVTMGIKEFVQSARRITNKVYLFKEFRDRLDIVWRIVCPRNLVAILFPPAILLSLFLHKYRKWDDFRLLPFIYVRAIYERLCLWRECIREGVFLI